MKSFLLIVFSLLCFGSVIAQKKSRKDFFGGPKDYRNLSNKGLTFSFGTTYTFSDTSSLKVDDRHEYKFRPKGKLGLFAEIGTVAFNLKKPKFKWGNLIKYTDWGIGFNLYGGSENTTLFNPTDKSISKFSYGSFYLGNVTGRLTFHHTFYIPKTTIMIDNGLGINLDYRVLKNSSFDKTDQELAALKINTQAFSGNFFTQLHYNLGIGLKLKRGSYLIPTMQLPILGMYAWNKGSARTNWFSSDYLPVIFKLKFIFLFEKRSQGGCENFGSEEDRKRNEEYMQNK
jgi:hypothetical protein